VRPAAARNSGQAQPLGLPSLERSFKENGMDAKTDVVVKKYIEPALAMK
jgi:hypothetical protein